MDAERARQRELLEWVEQALSLPPAQRRPWLAERCDGEHLDFARRLLAIAEECATQQAPVPLPTAPAPLDHQQGRIYGAYRLLDIIGQGGMGVVYRAERVDGAYDDQVAVKLISLASPSREHVGRFERERQLLSDLRHPNVATLLDGGTNADGIPYVVMQYVDGEPIDRYCATHRLSLSDRLSLFETVCRAVQAAHQRLVIHRDLKPDNVLVDETGFARLIDFGIATTLDPDSNAAARTQVVSLTPAYASPEQIRNEALTAAADVYSLGVMLYELLTGKRPYDVASKSAYEAERLLCESTPQRPSVAGATAQFSLNRLERKELDAIVLKAIEADPQRRYQTAGALADDLARFARRQAVSAPLDTRLYRGRRFLSRHLTAAIAGAVALSALVAGLLVSVHQADRANYELARAEAVRDYLTDILLSPEPYESDALQLGTQATIGELLDAAETRLDDDLLELPAIRADLYATIANAQMWMDRTEAALRTSRKALAVARQYAKGGVDELDALQLVAEVLDDAGEADQAIATYREAERMAQSLGDRAWEQRLYLYNNFAVALAADGRFDDALVVHRKMTPLWRRHGEQVGPGIQFDANLGVYLFETGATREALEAYKRALSAAQGTTAYEYYARRLDWRVGTYYEFAREPELARTYYERALHLGELPYVEADSDAGQVSLLLARLDAASGNANAARATVEAIGEAFAAYLQDPEAWIYYHAQAALALAEGRWRDAVTACDQAATLADALPSASPARKLLIAYERALAVAQQPQATPETATRLLREAVDGFERWAGPEHPLTLAAQASLEAHRGGAVVSVVTPDD